MRTQSAIYRIVGFREVIAITLGQPTTLLARVVRTFLGKKTSGIRSVAIENGAGGQNRTGYARLFRAALYQ